MPRFHFDFVERNTVLADNEGCTFATLEMAITDAIRQVRSMVSLEIADSGHVDLQRSIVLVENGRRVRCVSFSEAISVSV